MKTLRIGNLGSNFTDPYKKRVHFMYEEKVTSNT